MVIIRFLASEIKATPTGNLSNDFFIVLTWKCLRFTVVPRTDSVLVSSLFFFLEIMLHFGFKSSFFLNSPSPNKLVWKVTAAVKLAGYIITFKDWASSFN